MSTIFLSQIDEIKSNELLQIALAEDQLDCTQKSFFFILENNHRHNHGSSSMVINTASSITIGSTARHENRPSQAKRKLFTDDDCTVLRNDRGFDGTS